jgi:hypothetical protein
LSACCRCSVHLNTAAVTPPTAQCGPGISPITADRCVDTSLPQVRHSTIAKHPTNAHTALQLRVLAIGRRLFGVGGQPAFYEKIQAAALFRANPPSNRKQMSSSSVRPPVPPVSMPLLPPMPPSPGGAAVLAATGKLPAPPGMPANLQHPLVLHMDFTEKSDFTDSYQRNNKAKGRKNLRCFPSCRHEGHIQAGYCGRPVVVRVSYGADQAHKASCAAFTSVNVASLRTSPQPMAHVYAM